VFTAPFAIATYLVNRRSRITALPPRQLSSSALLVLRRSDREIQFASPPPEPSAQCGGDFARKSLFAASNDDGTESAEDITGSLPLIARYNFIAQLLRRHHDVAEYGCIYETAPRMVMQNVQKLAIYNPDLRRVDELNDLFPDSWKVSVKLHNILSGPLPKLHDAIYNLDMLEYVSPEYEDLYLENLGRSLSPLQGLLILGLRASSMPDNLAVDRGDPVSQTRLFSVVAAQQPPRSIQVVEDGELQLLSQRNDVRRYIRTNEGLKALLNRHFGTVLIFSITGDKVEPGALEFADYWFALCSHQRG